MFEGGIGEGDGRGGLLEGTSPGEMFVLSWKRTAGLVSPVLRDRLAVSISSGANRRGGAGFAGGEILSCGSNGAASARLLPSDDASEADSHARSCGKRLSSLRPALLPGLRLDLVVLSMGCGEKRLFVRLEFSSRDLTESCEDPEDNVSALSNRLDGPSIIFMVCDANLLRDR